eukprot:5623152-Amphidinium_carterae.1
MACERQNALQLALSVPGSVLYGALAGQWQELSEGRQQNLAAVLRSTQKGGQELQRCSGVPRVLVSCKFSSATARASSPGVVESTTLSTQRQ